MKKTLTLLAVFLAFGFMHPFYLGVCDLKYNAKEKALQGTVKLFVSDLEAALEKLNGKKTDLVNIKDSAAVIKLMNAYMKPRLQLQVNGKKLEYALLGFEKEEEAMWFYVEATGCPKPSKVLITNSLLYDQLKDQMNIVHLEVGGQKKSQRVVNPEKELRFEF